MLRVFSVIILVYSRHRRGSDLPEPEGGRPDKHREFIRAKYIDKRWFATPDDLQRDAEREAGRGLGRGKRESERKKSLTPKSRRNRGDRSCFSNYDPVGMVTRA